jgi:hypothetical protein
VGDLSEACTEVAYAVKVRPIAEPTVWSWATSDVSTECALEWDCRRLFVTRNYALGVAKRWFARDWEARLVRVTRRVPRVSDPKEGSNG